MSNHIKILTCFKTVADMDMMANNDWRINDDYSVETSFVKKTLNSSDESALEMTLKLSDNAAGFNVTAELTTFTVGDKTAESFLKIMYALGYDKAVCITPESNIDLRFNPLAVASVIGEYRNQSGKQDVIILGGQSDDGQNAQTPFLLAEYLQWPCISQVTDIALTGDSNSLTVTSLQDGYTLEQKIRLPVVLSVDNTVNAASLRIPTLKNKLNAAKKQPEFYALADFGLNEQALNESNDKKLTALFKQDNPKNCVFIEGVDAKEKAQILYHRYLKPRLKQ